MTFIIIFFRDGCISCLAGNWVHPGEFASSGIHSAFLMYFCVLPSLLFLGRWVFSRSRSVKWKLVPTWPVFFYNFRFDFFQNFPSWIFHFILWLVAQTRHYSFLSLFYLSIICSSCPTYLFSLSVGGGTRRTHSQKFNLKKQCTKKKDSEPELEDHVEDVDARRKKGKKKVAYFSPS